MSIHGKDWLLFFLSISFYFIHGKDWLLLGLVQEFLYANMFSLVSYY